MSEPTVVSLIADILRSEVRHSAGIPEGEEFRVDWAAVAGVVASRLNLHEERRQRLPSGVVLRPGSVRWDGAIQERRWVSDWAEETA